MPHERIEHVNRDGHRLAARLDLPPDREPVAFALFAHCFTCTKNLKAVGHISRALTQQGIGVLRFDFTGLGESEGDFSETDFSSNVEDLVGMAGTLAREREAPRLLVGHSFGGAAVLQAAAQLESVTAVATIGAPHDPGHVTHLFEDHLEEIERSGRARVTLAGRPFTIRKEFLDDLEEVKVDERLRRLDRALLVLHSPVDKIVGVENAARIFEAARHPKSFVSLHPADHLLSEEADALYAGTMIGAWATRFAGPTRAARRDRAVEENVVVASLDTADAFRTDVVANGHPLVADEPASVGGSDSGPSPYELLGAALGSCTTMTMRMYAERKDWPLERSVVRVTHRKIHARDCADCESRGGAKVDLLHREIELQGPLDAEQRERLKEIANRCPVHRTLTEGEIRVETRLRD